MKSSEVIANILGKLQTQLQGDFETIETFARERLEDIAELAMVLARERVDGIFKTNNQMFQRAVARLEKRVDLFVRDLALLSALTVEKAWNTVVSEVWGAINAVIGAAAGTLPLPSLPKP
ncbi:hypothetical protein LCL97_22515 [Seohaeicola saemankumensis]|nr:hypothetical protein [Seohaeicola saemankumensis]MCA0873616.1 hypothetical protein [Seohaeicola saemankumensis]